MFASNKQRKGQKRMCNIKKIKTNGFTLIELLTTMGIILVIMALTFTSAGISMFKAKLTATKSIIAKLETAVQIYYNAFGEYPPDLSYRYLGRKLNSPEHGEILPVLQFESKSVKEYIEGDINTSFYIDPWDNPYLYYFAEMVLINWMERSLKTSG